MTITQADFEDAARRTAILERELDIANADHIALWLEASRPLDNAISWLACRIIEAHEIEIAKAVRAAEARVVGEIVAWLRKDDFAATADALARGDHKENQP